MSTNSRKNCFFEDVDLNFSGKLKTGFDRSLDGCFITIGVPSTYVKKLFKYDICPIHFGPSDWGLKVKINNRTRIVLNGRKLDYYDGRILKDVPISDLVLSEMVIKRYGSALREAYNCDCYAIRIVIRESI